ncbi:MAG: hypothetical protein HOJ34_02095 [Kordiimonadaceae bacterium]|jgi:hypothetical protein|nr:hypothetical protein [Kordiimonadaceae bacterium]MBT6035455.1 hypothetical protein [Kordiimonadaceae bacterium]MBT6328549.1 hypothetical protein [Kordiimonadaceae bacterium]MBT7582612.1 hypothetical protein [Kordiimonadaceae bacterium]
MSVVIDKEVMASLDKYDFLSPVIPATPFTRLIGACFDAYWQPVEKKHAQAI